MKKSLFIFCFSFLPLMGWSESSTSHSTGNSPSSRPSTDKASSGSVGYVPGRYLEGKFQYQTSDGKYQTAKASFRAEKAGTFLNQNGTLEEYEKGDILFKNKDDSWFKSVSQTPAVSDEDVELSEVERLVVQFTNEERVKRGLPALEVSEKLLKLSRQKSANMARLGNLDHSVAPTPPGGENIAWNQQTAKEVVQAWMNSDGHRANILSRRYSKVGVGMANGNGPYWTQMFQ